MDNFGHLGGFIIGIPLGLLNVRGMTATDHSKLARYKVISILAILAYFITLSTLIYKLRLPDCYGKINCAATFCQGLY